MKLVNVSSAERGIGVEGASGPPPPTLLPPTLRTDDDLDREVGVARGVVAGGPGRGLCTRTLLFLGR